MKLKDLNAQIDEAKKALENLLHQRQAVKASINQRHKSLVDRVPLEIVCNIFELYVTKPADSYIDIEGPNGQTFVLTRKTPLPSPLPLGAICQTWRHIAWSTPRLWTSAFVDISVTEDSDAALEETYKFKAQMLSEWISRSGSLPLSIRIVCGEVAPYGQTLRVVQPIFDIVSINSRRCKELDLKLPARLTNRLILSPQSSGYQVLERLRIFNTSDDIHPTEFSSGAGQVLIAPKVLDLNFVPLHELAISWNNVTEVTAVLTAQSEVFELLRYAPKLQVCKLSVHFPDFPAVNHPHLLHPKLRVLDILSDPTGVILSHLTLPAIEHLVYDLKGRLFPTDLVLAFLARSGSGGPDFRSFGAGGQGGEFTIDDVKSNIKELHFLDAQFANDGADLIQIGRAAPNLTKLHIALASSSSSLNAFYRALSNETSSATSELEKMGQVVGNSPPLLPELEALQFIINRRSDILWNLIPEIFLPFKGDNDHFRPLETITIGRVRGRDEAPTSIDEETLEALRDLIYDGVRLSAWDVVGSKTFNLIPMPPERNPENGSSDKDKISQAA
ncbi:hypothetical protein CPB84DRAFT_872796 [Gymnopilus junonius]|uniref:F-box domain-containing protein n=1 Tax=Gymnopilus junonius TaxID=109634 RepID=A0A9P5NS99_GYMJU|nr:hypothetical protein CPB84DRAFT_872796 [Gymnopilus junonius]